MGNQHTRLQSSENATGREFQVQHTTTDSPLLPAETLAKLQEINPRLVDWTLNQTVIEAEHRRRFELRTSTFVLIERLWAVSLGGIVALAGLGIAAYVALQGHDAVAMVIGGSTLGTIVAVLVTKQQLRSQPAPAQKQSTPASDQQRKRGKA